MKFEVKENKKRKLEYQAYLPYAALLLLAAYFCFRQMLTGNVIIGSDTIFHYNRFYETAEQIKHGNFNWFMSMYGYSHSGRVINALYGPLFAYANGLLLLLVKTWYRYQIVSSFIVYAVGGIGMYRALRRFNSRRSVATILAMLYLTIGWMPRWQEATNFSGISAAMMPYGILVAADMIFAEKKIPWVKMGLLMAIALEVHLLTAVMYMAFLLPAWLYVFIKNKGQRQLWLETCQAVGLAVLLALKHPGPPVMAVQDQQSGGAIDQEYDGQCPAPQAHLPGSRAKGAFGLQPKRRFDLLALLHLCRPDPLCRLAKTKRPPEQLYYFIWRFLALYVFPAPALGTDLQPPASLGPLPAVSVPFHLHRLSSAIDRDRDVSRNPAEEVQALLLAGLWSNWCGFSPYYEQHGPLHEC